MSICHKGRVGTKDILSIVSTIKDEEIRDVEYEVLFDSRDSLGETMYSIPTRGGRPTPHFVETNPVHVLTIVFRAPSLSVDPFSLEPSK
jgi:hypothetical protein